MNDSTQFNEAFKALLIPTREVGQEAPEVRLVGSVTIKIPILVTETKGVEGDLSWMQVGGAEFVAHTLDDDTLVGLGVLCEELELNEEIILPAEALRALAFEAMKRLDAQEDQS